MTVTIGYDIGGAHLKIARIERGVISAVRQIACPLWQGLGHLSQALDEARGMTSGADQYAITMTGELCEIFSSRRDGVEQICNLAVAKLGPAAHFFMGLKGFGDRDAACADPDAVGSANFIATARLIAQRTSRALLIDMGSTTTDIIACDRPQGLTDAERLQTGELVYTGLTRTPVPSVTTRAMLLGQWQGLARDTFATMADVRRVLGTLAAGADDHATADGRGKSQNESLRRLARGFGRDGEMRHLEGWQTAAAAIREQQLASITDGALQVLSRPGVKIDQVVTAGIGFEEAAAVAQRLGLPNVTFADIALASDTVRLATTLHAPAVAVALLLDRRAS